MAEENTSGAFTPEESAYFESGGESAIPAETPVAAEPEPQAPAPEVQQPQEQGAERDEKGRFVPHQALHAEREEHKKTKAQLEELSRQQAVLNDRWQTIMALKEAPKEEQAPPDPEKDIFGYAKWQAEKVAALEKTLTDDKAQREQQEAISRQEAEIWSEWETSAQSYAAQTPDFGDAVKFLSEARTAQLKGFGALDPRFTSDAGINQQINNELRAIIIQAKQAGVSPAQAVHDIAKSYGFKAAPVEQGAQELKLPGQLATVAAAQEAAKTVGQGGGRAGGDALTPESLAAMPAAEFNAWFAKPENARYFEKLMGG